MSNHTHMQVATSLQIYKRFFFSFITGDIGQSDGCHTTDVYCPGERKNKQKPTQVLQASDTIYRAKLTTQQILKEALSPLLRNGDLIMINDQLLDQFLSKFPKHINIK